MSQYRVLVVDDERPARAKLARLLGQDPRFALVGEAKDGLAALALIEALRPQLLILDVQMPRVGGFEVLAALGNRRDFVVIFSTAHEEHALSAFDAHAVDYLLKPYDAARFQRALDKSWAQLAAGNVGDARWATLLEASAPQKSAARWVIKTTEAWHALAFDDVLRLSAANKHVCVSTTSGQHFVRQSLQTLEAALDPNRFVRVHRSEVVNVAAVQRLDPWTHGDGILVLSDGSTLVLTRTYRAAFLARFHAKSR